MMPRATFGYGTWEDPVRNKRSHNSGFPLYETNWPQRIRNYLIHDYQNSSGLTQQADPCRWRALSSACLQIRVRMFVSEGCSWRTQGQFGITQTPCQNDPARGGAEFSRAVRDKAGHDRRWWEDGGKREATPKTVVSAVGTAPLRGHMLQSNPKSRIYDGSSQK